MFSKLAEGGLRNLRKEVAHIVWLGMGRLRVRNQEAAEEFVQDFSDYVKANGFIPQQMFNCDETGLFWKKSQGGHTSPKRRKHYRDTNQ